MVEAILKTSATSGGKALNFVLWACQILLALAFGMFGIMKMFQPLEQLAVMMAWVPTVSPWFVRTLGAAEFLGALGMILPSLTRILPRLTVAATICFLVLQVIAVSLHISRGEISVLGLNVFLILLLLAVLWGRAKKSVILPR